MARAAELPGGEVFVGRRAELETLCEFAERAAAGRGHLVLVAGEAGVGKTSLFEQLSSRSHLPVRWGTCWPDSGQPPFWPWTQVLRADPPVRPPAGSPLAVLLTEVAGTEPDRFSVHEAVVAALRETGPAIVVLDDLHWVDEASAALLLHVARSLARMPLLVVGGYRETDVAAGSPWDALLGTLARLATTVSLGGLAAPDVAELMQCVAGRSDDALVAEVHLQSDGNALFATEVAKLVTAEGGFLRVPSGLAAVIKERLAGFDDETMAMLEAAAVLGLSCSLDEVSAVAGRPALPALAAPLRNRVLRSGGRPGEVRFTHALVRRTIVEGLAAPRLVQLHAAATRALEPGADQERAGRLAAHAVAAAPLLGTGPALEWSRRAAEAAAAGLGYADAARHLATVAELVDARQRPAALLELGRMLHRAGDTGGALDAFRRGLPPARTDGELFARFVLGIAGCMPPFAAPTEIMGQINEARGLVAPDAEVQRELAGQRWMRVLMSGTAAPGDREAAEAWADEVVRRARHDPDPLALHRAWAMQYPLLTRCDRVDERLRIAIGEAELADRTGALPVAADAGVHLLLAGVERADRAMLDDGLRRLGDVERLDRRPVRTMFLLTRRAMVAALVGDPDAAAGDLDAAERLATQADLPEFAVGNAVLRACLAHDTSAPAPPAAIRTLIGFFDAVPGLGFGPGVVALRALLDGADNDRADNDRADELLARVLAAVPAAPQDSPFSGLAGTTVLAEVLVRHRLLDPARRLRTALEPFGELVAVVALGAACVGPVAHALGLLTDLLGEPAAADRWFDLALRKAEALGSRSWRARVSAAWADSLDGRDEARAAVLRAGAGPVDAPGGSGAEAVRSRARLRRDEHGWLVEYEAATARLPHTKGLAYLAELVRHPGQERRALDLVALVDGHDGRRAHLGDAGPALDAQAKAAYRARLTQLRARLDAADDTGDRAASARAQAEIDALMAELGRAVGLGGRDRPIGSAAEKARLNVTRAIRAAIGRIGQPFPVLGEHLTACVHTGMSCSYLADDPLFDTG